VLYIGRLEPRKGVEVLIRAMAQVQRRQAGVRLVVVGEGPDRPALESLARASALDVLFTGRVADDQLPQFVQAAELLCSPALGGESFGIVLLESLAAGRPVIASRIPGYEELAAGADPIRLVPPGDPDGLAAEICRLLADDSERRELGSKGPEVACRFGWDRIAERLEEIYIQLAIHN
jgi:phosphatidylinositol alpha-mannosyltransferase